MTSFRVRLPHAHLGAQNNRQDPHDNQGYRRHNAERNRARSPARLRIGSGCRTALLMFFLVRH